MLFSECSGGTTFDGCIAHKDDLWNKEVGNGCESVFGVRIMSITHVLAKFLRDHWPAARPLILSHAAAVKLNLTHLTQPPDPSYQWWGTEFRLAAHLVRILPVLPSVVCRLADAKSKAYQAAQELLDPTKRLILVLFAELYHRKQDGE